MTHDSPQPSTTMTLAQLNNEFRLARGAESDLKWVRTAEGRLLLDGVNATTASEALAELLPTLRQTQEPVEELFGDPTAWAKDQQELWQQRGVQAYERPETFSIGQFLQATLISATGICLVVAFLAFFDVGWRTDLNWMMFALPVFIAAGTTGIMQVWTLGLRKSSRVVALLYSAAFLVALALLGGVLATTVHGSLGTGSVLWYLAPAPLYALLAFLIGRIHKSQRTTSVSTSAPELASNTEMWVTQLRQQLRLRADLSERQIRVIVDETRVYATEAETSLAEEFGTPESYAASFEPNTSFRARRSAWEWSGGSVLCAILLVVSALNAGTPWTWQTAVFAALFIGTLCYAVQSWRLSFRKN